MTWNVEWTPATEQRLADIWLKAPDAAGVTAAANRIDAALARDPQHVGEARVGVSRILIDLPLAISYDVILDDSKVIVWDVWRWQLPAP
jgi:hypothetical protein